jgi:putative salt-induced outer membrane protein YdiY
MGNASDGRSEGLTRAREGRVIGLSMHKASLFSYAVAVLLMFATTSTPSSADVIETKNGARLVGKVIALDGLAITLSTDYAGDIKVNQDEVVSVKTDEARFVRLSGGTVMAGTIAPTREGKIQITGDDGVIITSVDKLAATWAVGSNDPAMAALATRWTFDVAADITGKTGNSEQFGTSVSARAKRIGPTDVLQFYTAYNRQESDGETSADQFKAGLDYANNFAGRKSWYVRDEAGFDRVKDIELYNLAATGLGYDFIKRERQILTGRFGLAFRYEGYRNPVTDDVKSFGLDLGLHHEYVFTNAKLVNDLTYTPAFNDFTNYRATHESYFEMPLMNPRWKLRIGVSNDYSSQPGIGVEKLDTTYFTRFVLGLR